MKNILMIGSEAVPFSKTGGLADVLGALPAALGRLGWSVTLVVPRYRGVSEGVPVARQAISIGGFTADVGFFDQPMSSGARAILVDCPQLYDRESLYGPGNVDYPDNPLRFAMLARAALEYGARQTPAPSVVHAHDWQAALAPVYLKTMYRTHPTLGATPSVLTIHNLAYQGTFAMDWLPRLDLPGALATVEKMEFWGRISFLKGGIVEADAITTVSPTYAEEIQRPEGGVGFDGILHARRHTLVGILNGIDTAQWDPSQDPFLPVRFDVENLEGKRAAKHQLLLRLGLPADDEAMRRPLFAMISRLVEQKGLDLFGAVADSLTHLNAGFVVLGTGDPTYERMLTDLASRRPDHIGVRIGFDESLAHLIEGGADVFLMPSRFEPCGLNQMFSLRYGTIPLVRAVGGLSDAVDPTVGFMFSEYSGAAFLEKIEEAIRMYVDEPDEWKAMMIRGMRRDNSWDHAAAEYGKVYQQVMQAHRPRLD